MVFRKAPDGGISDYWAIYFGVSDSYAFAHQ
jgi:hypothetical protein